MGTLDDFLAWLDACPTGTLVSAAHLRDTFRTIAENAREPAFAPQSPVETSWREKLWTCPPETRLGVREASEAIGRPLSFAYRHTGDKCPASDRIPHRKLGGELVFVASELRAWLTAHEEIMARPPLSLHGRAS